MTQERRAPAHVERALQSVDPEERRRAVGLVVAVPIEEAVPLLIRALGDDDWRVRKEATFAARELLPADELLSALVSVLDSRDIGLCNAAVDVLGAAGAGATPHLVAAMATLGPDGRKLAVEALGSSRDRAALGPLSAALHDADANVRQTAAESIASLSAVAPDEVEAVLLRLLDDPDPIVKLSALAGLDTLGAVLPWDRLAPLLDNATLRPLALGAVARAGHAGAPAVLARALGASSGRTFDAALAAFALVPLDPLPDAAVSALRPYEPAVSERLVRAAAMGDDDAVERRRTALLVAAALGAPAIIAVAVDALGHPDLGDAAQAALERLGTPAVDALVARLDSRCSGDADLDGDACAQCIEALAHIAEQHETSRPAVLAALRRAVRVRSPRVAAQALYALGALGDAEDLALAEAQFLASQTPAAHAAEAALAALAARHPAAARALWDAAETAAPHSARPAAVALGALAEVKQLGDGEPRALRFSFAGGRVRRGRHAPRRRVRARERWRRAGCGSACVRIGRRRT
ncbi:MAG: HEAT repeat domain-containing protein [Polyangiaceae bacterium]|nr:HEAT repeat domain-containing protein [Polyangiaceae bacterium]